MRGWEQAAMFDTRNGANREQSPQKVLPAAGYAVSQKFAGRQFECVNAGYVSGTRACCCVRLNRACVCGEASSWKV